MRIVVDATSLLLRSAGVKNYLYYWLLSLFQSARDRCDELRSYPLGVPIAPVLNHQDSIGHSVGSFIRRCVVQLANIRGIPTLEILLSGTDLFHASQHVARLPRGKKNTATIFDLSCWTTPEYHTPANIAATRWYADTVLRNCDGLIAISRHTRDDAAEILHIPSERIRVIYPGVAESFFNVTRQKVKEARAKYKLDRPYFLFVGCIEPRKNVPTLLHAYQQVPASVQKDVQLVLAGPLGWVGVDVKNMMIRASGPVRYLGYVPEPDLPGLVGGALALAYPSYYEGFGLPVAQAMAAGIPVITSNRSCLPEVVGDAGLCVNPDSTEQLSHALVMLASSRELKQSLGLRGKSRAESFRWTRSAVESLDFFHAVSEGNS